MATSRPKVDIQGLIEDWATSYFRQKASKKERKLQQQDQIHMEIDWKRVKFVHEDAVYEPEPPAPGRGRPSPHVLYNTQFTNRTDQAQRYSFRTERTTRSSCSVTIEQCYTTGVEMNVKLTTPCQILEANAGFHRELALANSENETIEEEMTWAVDSEIEVKGRHIGKANLVIVEEEYEGRFTIKTHISGRVRVVFTNLKDNNSFVMCGEHQVVEIVKAAINAKSIQPGEALYVDGPGQRVTFTTSGKCRFKYGIKQEIEVDQRPIDDITNNS